MNTSSANVPASLTALDQWRTDILNLQLRLLLLLAVPAAFIDSIGGLQRGEFVPLLVNMMGYMALVILALLPRHYYHLRVISFLVISFGFGAFVLVHTGLVSAGGLFLLVAVIMSSFFLGIRATVGLWLLSAMIIIGVFSAYASGWINASDMLLRRISDPATLMTSGIAAIAMSALLSGAVLSLVERLSRSLREVESINTLLEQRVAERTAELQAALRTNRFLVSAVNNMSIGVLVSDAARPDNPTIFVNPAFTTITGYPPENVIGRNCRFLQGPETDPAAAGIIRKGIAERRPVWVELLNYRKDGTTFWNELSISPVFDGDKDLIGFVGLQSDVTARKHTESKLRERDHFITRMTETIPDVIYVRDMPSNRMIYRSRPAAEGLALLPDQLDTQGQGVPAGIAMIHPDDRALLTEHYARISATAENDVFELEFRMRRADGQESWILQRDTVFTRDPSGHPVQILGIAQDITRRKETELALKQINTALRQRLDELLALNRITQALARWTNLNEAIETVSTSIARLFDAAVVSVWEVDRVNRQLVRIGPGGENGVVSIADPPMLCRVVMNNQTLLLAAAECHALGPAWAGSAGGGGMLLPLPSHGGSIGALWLRARGEERVFTPTEVGLAQTIAGVVAVTVENGRLFRQARHIAAEEERRRLARELHDSVSQSLFAASVSADVLPQIWELDPDEGREVLDQIKRLTRGALAEMRTLLVELRPGMLVLTPLDLLFEHLVAAANTRLHGAMEADLAAMPALPPDVRIAFYRIGQEALTNVMKHAQASQTIVCLDADPPTERDSRNWQGTVVLTVNDDGQGFDPTMSAGGGLGLISLRERAAAIGAMLTIDTAVGAGTTISLRWSGMAVIQQERKDD